MATRTRYRMRGKSLDASLECVLDFPLASIRSDEHLAEAPFSRHAIRKLADYFQVDVGILAANL